MSFIKQTKGKTVVILDKCSFISATEEILNDNAQFAKLAIPTGNEINHIMNLDKRIPQNLSYRRTNKSLINLQKYKTSRF